MKPASIVFLGISLLLIFAGILTCSVAKGKAASEGVMLFPEITDGSPKYTVDYSDDSITKIDITVDDADVNVYGGAEKSYIEVINFKTNYYTISKTSKVLLFTEMPDLKSLLKFWENGFSFAGVRNLLRAEKTDPTAKVINVYVSDEELKQVKIVATNGQVSIRNLYGSSSFNVSVASGRVVLENITTTDSVTLSSVTKLKVRMNRLTSASFTAAMNNADFESDTDSLLTSLDIAAESGKVVLNNTLLRTKYSFRSEKGKVTLFGEDKTPSAVSTESATEPYVFNFNVVTTAADIEVKLPAID